MDPVACFRSILHHWRNCMIDANDVHQLDACIEDCDSLVSWIEHGGFSPEKMDSRDVIGFARIVRRLAQSQLDRMES